MRFHRPPAGLLLDAAIGAVTLALVLGSAFTRDGPAPLPGQVAAAVAACAALTLRRRHPVSVLVLTLLLTSLSGALGDSGGPVFVAYIVALYTAAAEGRLPAAIVLAVIAIIGMILRGSASAEGESAVLVAGWLVAVLAVGGVTWNRRAYLAEVEHRVAEAERGREADGRRRVTEERMRIARELHDVLAHNISMINVRAGAALFQLTGGPRRDDPGLRDELADALTVIRDAGRDAGRELRATLGVLRQADEAEPAAPAPGLARLPDLVDTAGRAGLRVRTTVEGPACVPAEVDLAAFRIVQEALTNVARHARTEEATVRISADSGALHIRVENTGAAPVAGTGYGIRGMRERAAALGGDLRAGPGGDGTFRVLARLPLREHA